MSRTSVGWIALVVVSWVVAGSGSDPAQASENSKSKVQSRSPASVVPGVPGLAGWKESFRVPMFTLPRKADGNSRWRLMGTCRNDIGMQQSVSGLGYGNCLKN